VSKRVHMVGVSGTGMGALAMLFRELGWEVRGSDLAFNPPIGPALEAAEVVCLQGFSAEHISGDLDLVVASLGALFPDNRRIGSVFILENDGHQRFTSHVVAQGIARVASDYQSVVTDPQIAYPRSTTGV